MNEKKKILIVEDEMDVMTYLKAIFEDNGYDTITAEDGVKGFEMAQSEKPDLITLDLAMPNQTGVRTYRQYKDDPELKEIPVVVITAVGAEMEQYFKRVPGFQRPEGFMSKPINAEELVKMVAGLLQ